MPKLLETFDQLIRSSEIRSSDRFPYFLMIFVNKNSYILHQQGIKEIVFAKQNKRNIEDNYHKEFAEVYIFIVKWLKYTEVSCKIYTLYLMNVRTIWNSFLVLNGTLSLKISQPQVLLNNLGNWIYNSFLESQEIESRDQNYFLQKMFNWKKLCLQKVQEIEKALRVLGGHFLRVFSKTQHNLTWPLT